MPVAIHVSDGIDQAALAESCKDLHTLAGGKCDWLFCKYRDTGIDRLQFRGPAATGWCTDKDGVHRAPRDLARRCYASGVGLGCQRLRAFDICIANGNDLCSELASGSHSFPTHAA